MKASKLLLAMIAMLGSIGIASAQTNTNPPSDSTSTPQRQAQTNPPSSSPSGDRGMQAPQKQAAPAEKAAASDRPIPPTGASGRATGTTSEPAATSSNQGGTGGTMGRNRSAGTPGEPGTMSSERPARSDRN